MASSKIRGITIEIDGDTTKLGKALEGAEKNSKNLSSELKGVNSLLKLDPSNVELLTQKQTLLNDSISSTKEKLDTLKSAQSQVQQAFERGNITAEQYRDFQREIIATEQRLKKLKDEAKDFGSVMKQQLEESSKKVKELGSKVEDVGSKFTILSGGAAAGLGYAAKSAASLEGAVNKVAVATGAGTKGTEELKNVLSTIHDNNYGEDYNDIAEKVSLVKQNMGDLSETDLIDVTQNAILLQDAFGMDFSESIRGINGLMTNMGVDAETAFNLMVTGAQNGLNKSDELGDNIAEYSQLWGQAGFSSEEMFTILQNGLDSGAYNLDKVNDLIKEMGISLADGRVEDNISSFSKGTQDLFEKWKTGGASQADVIKSMINDLGNMENEQEALTLASTIWSALGEDNAMAVITSLNKTNDTYKNTTGSIQQANEQMYSGTGAKAQEAMKKIETAFQTMGDAILPVITPIIESIASLATKFSELNPTIQKVILVILSLIAAAGPVIIFIGKIISSVGMILPLLAKIAPIFGIIKTAVSGLFTLIAANPVVAVIVAIIAVIVLLWTKCEWFRNLVIGVFDAIVAALKAVGSFLATVAVWIYDNVIKPIVSFYIEFYSTIFEGIVTAVKWVGSIIAKAASWVYENVIKPIIVVVLILGTLITEGIVTVWNFVVDILKKVGSWVYDNVISPVVNFFVACFDWFKTTVVTVWNFYISILKTIGTWIYSNVIQPVIKFFLSCYETIKNAFKAAWDWIKNIFNTVASWINTNVIQPIVKFFTGLWNSITSIFGNVKTFFTNKFKEAYNGITSVFSGIKDWFTKNVWNKITEVFSGAKEKMAEIGGKIWSGLKSAFKNPLGLKVTYEKVGGLKGKLVDALGLDGWPKLNFAAKGAVLTSPTPLLAGEYPNAVNNPEIVTPQNIMKDTMMDALTSFNNARYQNGTSNNIGELTKLLKMYMPEIINNISKDIVLDGKVVGKSLAPVINSELGVISSRQSRGY